LKDFMSPSALVLLAYAGWTLLLLAAIAVHRSIVSVRDRRAPNSFSVAGDDVSAFSARLCRAHANCCENLPIVGAVIAVAWQSGQGGLIDGLAPWLLAARLAQSSVHLMSTSVPAVCVRFGLQVAQMGILALWAARLLTGGAA
jgi:uncharacterized MAPEG superfamily protein